MQGWVSRAPNASFVRATHNTLLFLVFGCAALCAADLGHAVVAALTRFGLAIGPYGSYNHGAVIPALLAAGACALLAFLNIVGQAIARATRLRGDWLSHVAAMLAQASTLRIAPAVFIGQLLVLFAMESAEQIAALGHPLGLIASFGGPLLFVLAIHAIAALIVVAALLQACRALMLAAQVIADAARPMLRLSVNTSPALPNVRRLLVQLWSETGQLAPLATRIANRPPPPQIFAA